VRGQKKQLFCKLKLGHLGWGLQMCCFCAWGVVFLNATIGRKVRGGKKLKPHAEGFALVEIIFVLIIFSLSSLY
jgi:type II secretory pathway pseudopilin PulG